MSPGASTYDAVVIGAGPNGLVAANRLADAGWSVLVLEAAPGPGGGVHSSRDVHPDYVHDTCSAFYPLSQASPALTSLGLEEYGLRWQHAPAPLGHPLPDGRWALLHRDRDVTAAGLDELQPGDGEAWLELCRQWDRISEHVVGGLLSPFPPVREGAAALARLPLAGRLGADIFLPLLTVARRRFRGEAPALLLAGNAAHADIPLTGVGSGLFGILLTMLGQTVGFPAPQGGAGELTAALVRRLEARGGELVCDAEVTRVEVEDGRAVGVRTRDGARFAVRRAVLADVVATRLFGGRPDDLVPRDQVPRRVRAGMRRFQIDPSTVKVDWALDGPVPWAAPPAHAPGTVHLSTSLAELTGALDQVAQGRVPDRPFLLSGQMTTTDPTRSPAGTESVWAYTHIPQGAGLSRGDLERFADRMQGRFEQFAPGFGERVVARRVMGPADLEAHDANLVGGAINGGTAQIRQQLVLRPVPGNGRPTTGIDGLYLASASAHPGGGVHGACGANAAHAALRHAED